MKKRNEIKELKANAIKYRHLKLSVNNTLNRLLTITDSLYTLHPGDFEKEVNRRELIKKNQTVTQPSKQEKTDRTF